MMESYIHKGIRHWREVPVEDLPAAPTKAPSYRDCLGTVLRERRFELGLILREVSSVSYAYVSEIERGKKEASSEILHAMCQSLDISVPEVLRRTADLMDGVRTPVTKELVNA